MCIYKWERNLSSSLQLLPKMLWARKKIEKLWKQCMHFLFSGLFGRFFI